MTAKEIFDKKYEYYRNMEGKPSIPLEARDLIFSAMKAYAKQAIAERMPTEEEAGAIAVSIASVVSPRLTTHEEAFFVAGFTEFVKWFRSRIEEKPEEEYIDKSISIDEYMEKNPKLDPHEQ
jgi:hypothetical protein